MSKGHTFISSRQILSLGVASKAIQGVAVFQFTVQMLLICSYLINPIYICFLIFVLHLLLCSHHIMDSLCGGFVGSSASGQSGRDGPPVELDRAEKWTPSVQPLWSLWTPWFFKSERTEHLVTGSACYFGQSGTPNMNTLPGQSAGGTSCSKPNNIRILDGSTKKVRSSE